MNKEKIYRSPLFYVGDKFKLIEEIQKYFPRNIKKFIEPFAGGGTVYLNVDADEYYLNDIDYYVYSLHVYLMNQAKNSKAFFKKIEKKIRKFNLSQSYLHDIVPSKLKMKWKKTYYAHLKEFIDKYKRGFSLFIPPKVHVDTCEYAGYVKYKDELDIRILEIEHFLEQLEVEKTIYDVAYSRSSCPE